MTDLNGLSPLNKQSSDLADSIRYYWDPWNDGPERLAYYLWTLGYKKVE